jgi:hypothetical protein
MELKVVLRQQKRVHDVVFEPILLEKEAVSSSAARLLSLLTEFQARSWCFCWPLIHGNVQRFIPAACLPGVVAFSWVRTFSVVVL